VSGIDEPNEHTERLTGDRMKKLALTFVLLAAAAFAGEWTGYVSETKCGTKHNDGSAASVGCVKACIKGGAKPALVVDGKLVAIANPDKVPEALYGLRVTVTGDLKDDAIQIETIDTAK
jgi:hypothetical protein